VADQSQGWLAEEDTPDILDREEPIRTDLFD
jgi:hypothetical protein